MLLWVCAHILSFINRLKRQHAHRLRFRVGPRWLVGEQHGLAMEYPLSLSLAEPAKVTIFKSQVNCKFIVFGVFFDFDVSCWSVKSSWSQASIHLYWGLCEVNGGWRTKRHFTGAVLEHEMISDHLPMVSDIVLSHDSWGSSWKSSFDLCLGNCKISYVVLIVMHACCFSTWWREVSQ